ncbi:MAG: hypothetical protein ABI207_04515, partial [Crocinitomicaceae bacterium]
TVGKIFERSTNFDQIKNKKLKDIKPKTFKKVLYDTEYIQIDVRKYPSITGNLGDYYISGDLDEYDL